MRLFPRSRDERDTLIEELAERVEQLEAERETSLVSRRRFFTTAGAAAAGGVAGAVLGGTPAGATVGTMQFGTGNDAAADSTQLTSNAGNATLFLDNTGAGSGIVTSITSTTNGTALRGSATGVTGTTTGVAGSTASTTAVAAGVAGSATGTTGTTVGVRGQNSSTTTDSAAMLGLALAVTGETTGVRGDASASSNALAAGVRGHASAGAGVAGFATTGYAVRAEGGKAQVYVVPANSTGSPVTGTHFPGEMFVDATGDLFLCISAGTPGDWTKLNEQQGVGPTLTLLATPTRVYDSRVGQGNPSGSPQGPLAFGAAARQINCTPSVPVTASAILMNLAVVPTAGSFGALSVFAANSPDSSAASINWTSPGTVLSNAVTSACDGTQDVKVKCIASAGCATEFIIDIVGHYSS